MRKRKNIIYCCCPVARSYPTVCDPSDCSMTGLPVPHYLSEFAQVHVHGVSDAIQSSHPLSSLLVLPSIFPSIRIFSRESACCIRWPKYWSSSCSITPSNGSTGFISYRIDWFEFLSVQRTLKTLLQHHSSKASILWHIKKGFFMVQLSHPYDHWKNHSLD